MLTNFTENCCMLQSYYGFFLLLAADEIYILVYFNIQKTSWHWQFYDVNIIIITWMPWTFAFKAATRRSVLAGLMSPRSNFLLTKRRGIESIFQPLDLFGLLETNSGILPLSTAHRRKTRWRSTYEGESQDDGELATAAAPPEPFVYISQQWFLKILTSSAFWSKVSTSFTRNSKQSSVKRSVIALSNPLGAGDISKDFLLPYGIHTHTQALTIYFYKNAVSWNAS